MTEFLKEYLTLGNLIFVLVGGGIIAFLYFKGYVKKSQLLQWVEEYILLAEQYFKTTEGEEKILWVVEKVYACIPSIGRIFITKDTIRKVIQEVFDRIKELVQDEDGTVHSIPSSDKTLYLTK